MGLAGWISKRWHRATSASGFEVAQVLKVQRQIPPLYALLSFTAASVAFTHRHVAPLVLTAYIPGALILLCLWRLVRWATAPCQEDISRRQAIVQLRRMTWIAGILAGAFVAWAIVLDQYGDATLQGHVAISVAITVLGCVFCLGYHPKAALAHWLVVVGTFSTYCFFKDSEATTAIALNIALVSALILKAMVDSFASFVNLERSTHALEQKQNEAHELSAENAALAQTDFLTGLPNRRFFFRQLETLLGCPDAPFAVGLMDLDGFKSVNDTYGHAQGDQLLVAVASRLGAAAGELITVARLGGDEFGFLMRLAPDQALAQGQALCDAIRAPVELTVASINVGCSMGIAVPSASCRTAGELFERADSALYHAKDRRRGGCIMFSPSLEDVIRSGQKAAAAFQSADLEQELSVVFQPIFDIQRRMLVGVEALARWHSPSIGVVAPEQLISAAERTGMARQTTTVLFRKALRAGTMLPAGTRLTFNLSALDLADDRTVSVLLAEVEASGLAAERIVFELTEHSVIADLQTVRRSLDRLKGAGAQLALDDFGTGYSSLSLLHELPFDFLKIDRSFAAQLSDPTGRRLVEAIRGLADTLSLRCVLEGIETQNQLDEAVAAGFEYAQGYHLARPGPIDAALAGQGLMSIAA
ncbi:MAG: EAL domain-containing protein [Sphingomonadales bacterium]|nr:EAL domain-containing protein [Sphingomonadales bacterium]